MGSPLVQTYRFGPYCLDPSRRTLTRLNEPVAITGKAFDVLVTLLQHHGEVVDKRELLRVVWPGTVVDEANLSQQIFTLRKLLGEAPDRRPYISTAPKRGYGFFGDVDIDVPAAGPATGRRREGRAVRGLGDLMRLTMELPPSAPLALSPATVIALSRDGRRLVYVAAIDRTTRLYVRELNSLEARAVAGTDGAVNPFLSPDGLWIGFVAGQRMLRVSVGGGTPLTICEIEGEIRGATWTAHGHVVFAPGPASNLWQVSAAGGQPQPLTTVRFDQGERTHRWPHALPDVDAVLFTIGTAGVASFDEASLAVTEPGGGHRVALYHGSDGRYAASGHLVYSRRGALLKTPFDLPTCQARGSGQPVVSDVATAATGAGPFALSTTGTLVYASGEAQTLRRSLVSVDSSGARLATIVTGEGMEEPRLSPDKRRVVVGLRGRHTNLWVHDFERAPLMRLTFESDNFAAIWGPEEGSVTFSSNRTGVCDLFGVRADAGGSPDLLVTSEYDKVAGAWSPDRSTLAYTEYHPETGANIWLFDRAAGTQKPWLCSRFNEYAPAFSPNGELLAYTSDQSGRPEVYVARVAHPGCAWQVSTDGGAEPLWAPDGHGLVYRNGDRLMLVDVRLGPEQAGVPRTLFEGRYVPGTLTGLANYENGVVPGTFLMVADDEPPRPTSLTVVLNWFTELAAKD